jgi:hypothetical protein
MLNIFLFPSTSIQRLDIKLKISYLTQFSELKVVKMMKFLIVTVFLFSIFDNEVISLEQSIELAGNNSSAKNVSVTANSRTTVKGKVVITSSSSSGSTSWQVNVSIYDNFKTFKHVLLYAFHSRTVPNYGEVCVNNKSSPSQPIISLILSGVVILLQ